MAVQDTLLNRVFDRRYRVLRKLGTGGMADVYLAEDQELGRRVAIKILNERHANDDQFIERFRREAKNAAGLSHPNIVSVYDRGEAEGTYYIAMEYLEGRSLKELIVGRGPPPVRIAIDYTRQILAAIGFAHRHGIIHRDIKPHNVLVDAEGRLKVTDFGIARSSASQMTEVGSIIGTAQYLSPEQARGAPVDATSDLYSVGIVLYEMLTGTVPFTGETPLEIAMKHLSAVPEPPSERRPDIPHDLDLVVLRSLAKDPQDRYHSAAEMDADLVKVARGLAVSPETAEAATAVLSGASFIAGAPTAVVPRPTAPASVPPAPRPPAGYYGYEEPPPRRRPIWPWLLALLLLAATGVAAWFAYTKIQDQLNANQPVAVEDYRGLKEDRAVQKVRAKGLVPRVQRQPDLKVPVGVVKDQDPPGGAHLDKGNAVKLVVSSGKPKTSVPSVVGKSKDDAVSTLANSHLKADPHFIYSEKPKDAVTAQAPLPGKLVLQNSTVRINISRGVQPVTVPDVRGQLLDQATATLQAAGFAVGQSSFVESAQAKNTVLAQDPGANTHQVRGTTVTLTVSKGPKSSAVPDVTTFEQAAAVSSLRKAGFKVDVIPQTVNDPTQDGIVIDQNPAGGANAPQGTTVTIFVGKLPSGTTP